MRRRTPSTTARWVATWRGLAEFYPAGMQLSGDPLGLEFALVWGRWLASLSRLFPRAARWFFGHGPFFGLAAWLQLRTRAIDDEVRRFVSDGGDQLVLLGAGFDVRAVRLPCLKSGPLVFEVDHPATQEHKRRVLAAQGANTDNVRYLSFDFEQNAAETLAGALSSLGHDPSRPTLTLWEGVLMYLSEPAIASSLSAIASYSAPGSGLVVNYVDRSRARAKTPLTIVSAGVGEPFRAGFEPDELSSLLSEHGWSTRSNRSDVELARQYFPAELSACFRGRGGWLAVAGR